MSINVFDVHVDAQMGIETELKDVEVSVSYPAPTMQPFADGGMTLIRRNGKLSMKTGEFPGWYSAEIIWLKNKETGEDSRYEVNRHKITPYVEGDWVVFPISSR
ncbi:hypothetical protein PspCFBP13509_00705 [Pseudomonas sp. CFBP13509]|uniref:hypothetical protein n=1 Tax=Pseudomonas sp. CFBP13509 TaxID=2184008 RepID=UPI0010C08906|nr:hypothetical protein [Pseudomonas sp. CFBP13509]TKJ81956.1 hypothetical protein PspCFBP13509_00705 [Pseudomonas sp. CFBP13509]